MQNVFRPTGSGLSFVSLSFCISLLLLLMYIDYDGWMDHIIIFRGIRRSVIIHL